MKCLLNIIVMCIVPMTLNAAWTELTNTQLIMSADAVIVGTVEEVFFERGDTYARIWVERIYKGELTDERIILPFHRPSDTDPNLASESVPSVIYQTGMRYLLLLVRQGSGWDVFHYPQNVVVPLDNTNTARVDMLVSLAKALDISDEDRAHKTMISLLSKGDYDLRMDILKSGVPLYSTKIEEILLLLGKDALAADLRAIAIHNVKGKDADKCIEVLRQTLLDHDSRVQSESARILAQLPGGIAILAESLENAAPSNALMIMEYMDVSNDPVIFEKIVHILKSSSYREPRALPILYRCDPAKSLREILNAFRYGSQSVQQEAINILSDAAHAEVLQALKTVLFNKEDGYELVIPYLAKQDNRREELLAFLEGFYLQSDSRETILKGIASMHDLPRSASALYTIYKLNDEYSDYARELLFANPKTVVAEDLKLIFRTEADQWVKSDAIDALARIKECDFLMTNFPHSGSSRIRRAFIYGLSENRGSISNNVLLRELKTTTDENLVVDIIRALAKSNDITAAQDIVKILQTTNNPVVEEECLITLGKIPTADGENILWERLSSTQNPNLRAAAAASLGSYHSATTIDKLTRQVFHDSITTVRLSAIQSLGRIGGEAAISALSDFLKYNILPANRPDIVLAINETGLSSGKELLIETAAIEENPATLSMLLDVIANNPPEDTRTLFLSKFRSAPEDNIAIAASKGLGHFTDDEVLATLIEGYDVKKGQEIRIAIIEQLGNFNSDAALKFLMELCLEKRNDYDLRKTAYSSIAHMGSEDAIEWLFNQYNDEISLQNKHAIANSLHLVPNALIKSRVNDLAESEVFFELKEALRESLRQMPIL